MSTQNVRVALRIRPLTAPEILIDAVECVTSYGPVAIVGSNIQSSYPQQQKSFTFDYVLDTASTQTALYTACVEPLQLKFQEGYNATIVAYGQTGSGKTFCMGTGLEVEGLEENQGVVPRVIRSLFSYIVQKESLNPTGYKSSVSVTFLELYNEDLIDLLNPQPGTSDLSIREDGSGNIVWTGVREERVLDSESLLRCLQKGSLCRTTGSTDMNASSSRSHAIFTIILKQEVWTPNDYFENAMSAENPNIFNPINTPSGAWVAFSSKFHFVDLAGSERLKRTNAAGDRMKEGISINQGLLSLGNVISALGDDNRKSSYVPFRDSKLTRLLQDSLGGNSQTLMIACVSPSNTNYGETISTLHYANRARNIKNKVSINQIMAANSGSQEKELIKLRLLVSRLQNEIASASLGPTSDESDEVFKGLPSVNPKPETSFLRLERQIQQHISVQQDMQSEIHGFRKLLKSRDFEVEKLSYFQNRLYERSINLNKELTSALAQRDRAIIDNARIKFLTAGSSRALALLHENSVDPTLNSEADTESTTQFPAPPSVAKVALNSASIPSQVSGYSIPLAFSTNSSDTIDLTSPILTNLKSDSSITHIPESSNNEMYHVIQGYLSAISHLRLKLADTDDKLRWYKTVFETLGTSKSPNIENIDLLHEMIPAHPEGCAIRSIAEENERDVDEKHERRLFRALRENPELKKKNAAEIPEMILPSSFSSFSCDDGILAEEAKLTPFTHIRSSSLYLLVDKIQNDISDNEQIVSRLQQRDAEYEAMKSIFEQKLSGFKVQLTQVQRERDLAIQRMRSDTLQPKERAGTIAIKARFDKKHRQLEAEIQDLRQKLAMRSNSKSQSATLTRNFMSTIQSLKAEKANMTRKLKQEAEKSRDSSKAKERELEKLRVKSDEMLRKIERNEHLKRTSINSAAKQKIKNVFSIIRSTSSASRRQMKDLPMAAIIDLNHELTSPLNENINEDTQPPPEVRAQFKKQMLEKELEGSIRHKRVLFKLQELKHNLIRLIGEQRELLVERERCIVLDTGEQETECITDNGKSYYMDDRLEVIDFEIAMINSRVSELESEVKIIGCQGDDDAFQNAENILRSLDSQEVQLVSSMLMKETADLRVVGIEREMRMQEKDKMLLELRAVLETTRSAALKTSIQFERKIAEIQEDAKRVLEMALSTKSLDGPNISPPRSANEISRLRSMVVLPVSPLPQIPLIADGSGVWKEHGNDPAIVAQAVINNALISSSYRSITSSPESSAPRKTLEELNADLGKVRSRRLDSEKSSSRRPSRPQSAPLLHPILCSDKEPSSETLRIVPRRTPSPGKIISKKSSQLSPIHVSNPVEYKNSDISGDDSKIWQEALNVIQRLRGNEFEDGGNVFERLASKHTLASYQKKAEKGAVRAKSRVDFDDATLHHRK